MLFPSGSTEREFDIANDGQPRVGSAPELGHPHAHWPTNTTTGKRHRSEHHAEVYSQCSSTQPVRDAMRGMRSYAVGNNVRQRSGTASFHSSRSPLSHRDPSRGIMQMLIIILASVTWPRLRRPRPRRIPRGYRGRADASFTGGGHSYGGVPMRAGLQQPWSTRLRPGPPQPFMVGWGRMERPYRGHEPRGLGICPGPWAGYYDYTVVGAPLSFSDSVYPYLLGAPPYAPGTWRGVVTRNHVAPSRAPIRAFNRDAVHRFGGTEGRLKKRMVEPILIHAHFGAMFL